MDTDTMGSEQYGLLMVEQLREQINNVMAAIQLLSPVIQEQEEPRYAQYLAIANQSLYRLLRLTGNVEFIQKQEQGEPPVVFRPAVLDLAGLCRELCRQVEPLADKAGVAFSYEESQGSLLTTGDAALLQRMLLNLFSNALRGAGPGGRMGLRLTRERDRAVITIWNSGQEKPSPGSEGGFDRNGLGLGISVARTITALHQGGLVWEDRGRQGEQTAVSLPVGTPPSEQLLRTPSAEFDAMGGFSPVLVELSDVLPYQAFVPEDVE